MYKYICIYISGSLGKMAAFFASQTVRSQSGNVFQPGPYSPETNEQR